MLLATACTDDDASIDDLFIPNVSNQWTSDRNSIFFFTTEQSNVSESTFTGNEQPQDNSNDVYQLEGSFKNHDIEYTFSSGPETGIKYTGKFIEGASLKIKATGSNGKKVEITRN
ncbi:hypothetical protein ADIARSV_4009 [Arcticibacter svalbardensis MN12-7]|uniref:Lipocalin-like domain-containing protein n=2 Tax=Arcticibacter TaxID=1288026 RepID=R9GMJ1_9SPHI|nr:hypothetical protein ADIARSV_4009 [Arcticibacter svalbardensis MN12-7]